MKELEEIVRLFKAAVDSLNMGRDHVTSKAMYNQAQSQLDGLEKDMRSPAGALVRKARPAIRAHLMHEKSLHKRFETSLAYWTQALESGLD